MKRYAIVKWPQDVYRVVVSVDDETKLISALASLPYVDATFPKVCSSGDVEAVVFLSARTDDEDRKQFESGNWLEIVLE